MVCVCMYVCVVVYETSDYLDLEFFLLSLLFHQMIFKSLTLYS